MNSTEEALRCFRNFLADRDKKKKMKKETVTNIISALELEAVKNGLPEKDIELCAKVISSNRLNSSSIESLLKSMIPVKEVSKEAILLILGWISTFYKTAGIRCLITALKWIASLLDFGLTNEETVDGFYLMFYFLLHRKQLEPHACRLIYKLTKSEDVSRWRVNQILRVVTKYGPKKHTNAVLGLFKSLKPECVPEKVLAVNVNFAFRSTEDKMNEKMLMAQQRKQAEAAQVDEWVRDLTWTIVGKSGKRTKIELIPRINYIHFGSSLYREEETRSILEFNKLEVLGCFQLSLDMPCNMMSLLDNVGGFHILTFGSSDLQGRLSYTLFYTLHRALIERERNVDIEEQRRLLKQVYGLEQHMQQGIPIVSRFLGEYLHLWNGYDFFLQILNLIEWITFSSYEELYDIILEHLRNVFLSSKLHAKCVMISTLGKVLKNLLIAGAVRKQRKLDSPFLKVNEELNFVEVAQNLTNFTIALCELGLTLDGNAQLLDESLLFFEMMVVYEKISGLPLWTIISPGVIYRCLFTRNPTIMNRACNLLLKYTKDVYPRLKQLGPRNYFKDLRSKVECYVVDFLNCMWDEKAVSNRDEGYIFKNISEKTIKMLSKLVNVDTAFGIAENYVIAPSIYFNLEPLNRDNPHIISQKACLALTECNFPDIYELLQKASSPDKSLTQ